jgi:hypothetical protein
MSLATFTVTVGRFADRSATALMLFLGLAVAGATALVGA